MSVEAMISPSAQPEALHEATNFIPNFAKRNSSTEVIKKLAIGTLTVGIGAAMMIDGTANNNNAEIFVGGLFLGYGLSVLLR
jgi:hypothetical protein